MVEQGFVNLIQNALNITPVIAAPSSNNFDFGGTPDLQLIFTATSVGTWGNNIQVNVLTQMQAGGSSFSGFEGVPSTTFSITTGGNNGQTVWVYVATDDAGNSSTTVGDLLSALNSNTDVNWFMTATTNVTDVTTIVPLPNPYGGANSDSTSPSGYSSGMSANLGGGANALAGYNLPGGFPIYLPKDFISAANPQGWTYRSITSKPLYVLEGEDSLTAWTVQLDCHGLTMNDSLVLARKIDSLLSGSWHGTFTDPDRTVVTSIFKQPLQVDGFSEANRSYVRSLEYTIHYYQIASS